MKKPTPRMGKPQEIRDSRASAVKLLNLSPPPRHLPYAADCIAHASEESTNSSRQSTSGRGRAERPNQKENPLPTRIEKPSQEKHKSSNPRRKESTNLTRRPERTSLEPHRRNKITSPSTTPRASSTTRKTNAQCASSEGVPTMPPPPPKMHNRKPNPKRRPRSRRGTRKHGELPLRLYRVLPSRSRAPLAAPTLRGSPEGRGPVDQWRKRGSPSESPGGYCSKGKMREQPL